MTHERKIEIPRINDTPEELQCLLSETSINEKGVMVSFMLHSLGLQAMQIFIELYQIMRK